MLLPKLALPAALLCAAVSARATAQAPVPAAPQSAPGDVPPPPPPPAAAPPAPSGQQPGQVVPPQSDVPPPPPAYQTPGEPPPAAGDASCAPACRTGYVCQQGQCVSACNPPCPAGQQCTAAGECIADPNAPPPAFYAKPEAQVAPPPEEGSEQHDGFMLRATIGFGGAKVTRTGSPALFIAEEAEYSGAGLLWSIDVGGSPVDNLVLHGRLAQITLGSPDTTYDGDEEGTVDELGVSAVLVAPAVSYYFMPINLYATAAVGLGVIVVTHEDDEDAEATSDAGLGLNLDVGKEWWVNDQWGFGVTGRFWYTRAKDEETADAEFDCIGGGLVFSATYQ